MDERMAMMLNAILQMESQGEGKESVTEAVPQTEYPIRSRQGGCRGLLTEA